MAGPPRNRLPAQPQLKLKIMPRHPKRGGGGTNDTGSMLLRKLALFVEVSPRTPIICGLHSQGASV